MKIFSYKRVLRMRDTDATGVLYFTAQLEIALEAFEEYLRSKSFLLQEMIEKGEFLLPIVHTQADFFSPMTLGQEMKVELEIERVGVRSFTHTSHFFYREKKRGKVSIVHASLSPQTKKAIPLPPSLLSLF